MFFHRRTPFILIGGATASMVDSLSSVVIASLGLLLVITKWRFLKLLQGETKLGQDK